MGKGRASKATKRQNKATERGAQGQSGVNSRLVQATERGAQGQSGVNSGLVPDHSNWKMDDMMFELFSEVCDGKSMMNNGDTIDTRDGLREGDKDDDPETPFVFPETFGPIGCACPGCPGDFAENYCQYCRYVSEERLKTSWKFIKRQPYPHLRVKRKCANPNALCDHVTFPTAETVPRLCVYDGFYFRPKELCSEYDESPARHWCMIAELVGPKEHNSSKKSVHTAFSQLSEVFTVISYMESKKLTVGNTVFQLYSQLAPKNEIVLCGGEQYFDRWFVFEASIKWVYRMAQCLLDDADLESANRKPKCFTCGKYEQEGHVVTKMLRCSSCRLAKYCSTECQKKHWSEEGGNHKKLCKDSEMLLRVAALPRHQPFNVASDKMISFQLEGENKMPKYKYSDKLDKRLENAPPQQKKNIIPVIGATVKSFSVKPKIKESVEKSSPLKAKNRTEAASGLTSMSPVKKVSKTKSYFLENNENAENKENSAF